MENMDKGLKVPKWNANILAQNTYPNCPKIYLPNLSAQAQKFWFSMKKKASLGVRSPWLKGTRLTSTCAFTENATHRSLLSKKWT